MASKLKKKPSLRVKEFSEHRLCNGSNSRDKGGSHYKIPSTDTEEISDELTSTESLHGRTVDEIFDYVLHNLKEAGKIFESLGEEHELNDSLKQVKSTSTSNAETNKQVKSPYVSNHRRKRT